MHSKDTRSLEPSGLSRLAAGETASLEGGRIHVWRLAASTPWGEDKSRCLSDKESAQRAKFAFDADRGRFTTAHVALRLILSGYLARDPRTIAFTENEWGKPELAGTVGTISFNVSHSGDLVLVAFAVGRQVGVDVEQIKPGFPVDEVAPRFFAPGEIEALNAYDGDEKTRAFFRIWTRKEALIKAVGKGLSMPLASFEVRADDVKGSALKSMAFESDGRSPWTVEDLRLAADYAAAIAYDGTAAEMVLFGLQS